MLIPKLRRTEHIEVSTGSRRRPNKKMEASREKSGKVHQDTLVTGETTARKASVSNSFRTVTSMKACGPKTRDMVRVHTGEMKPINSEENTLVTGMKTRNTVEVLSSTRMATDTMATG